jgi:ATP-dependent protease ClpP protease subunit
MKRNNLLAVLAGQRPPEMPNLGSGADWKFETRALADSFRHFTIEAKDEAPPTISIFDYIGDDGDGGGVGAKRIAAALRTVAGKDIVVEINSPGGNYFEGVAVYNLLRRHDAKVTVQVLGIAASAASVIAMAGDEIQIATNAEIMIHEARGLFMGTKSEMQEAMETLAHLDSAMCETYAARSGREVAEFETMIAGKDVFFRGQQAIDAGLADKLIDREAQMPVYAAADDQFPSDRSSLDKFLEKQGMPRAERKELFREITPEARRAEGNAEQKLGITQEQQERLLRAMS